MNVFKHLVVACALSAAAIANAGEPAKHALNLAELLAEEPGTQELFVMCCWAKGRAGFHYCEQYGVCDSDPEATCKGVGAAEGSSMSCKSAPPAEDKQEG